VPSDQFGKRGLRPPFGVIAQKLLVGQLVHSWKSSRRSPKRTEQGDSGLNQQDDIGLLGLPALPEPIAHKVAPIFHSLPMRCTFFPTVPVPPFSPSICSRRMTSLSERISLFKMRILLAGPNWLEMLLRN
jgi:hypothetical protein